MKKYECTTTRRGGGCSPNKLLVPVAFIIVASVVALATVALPSMQQQMQAQQVRYDVAYSKPSNVPLPKLHEQITPREMEHFKTQARQAQALQGRQIIGDPNSNCKFYDCSRTNSFLRVCFDPRAGVYAVQWIYYEIAEATWKEGTIFTNSNRGDVNRPIRSNGCVEMVQ